MEDYNQYAKDKKMQDDFIDYFHLYDISVYEYQFEFIKKRNHLYLYIGTNKVFMYNKSYNELNVYRYKSYKDKYVNLVNNLSTIKYKEIISKFMSDFFGKKINYIDIFIY